MVANRNGVVFSGSSQVNVRNLVAAAASISDSQFRERGLYFDANGSQPSFTDAAGAVRVEQGALLQTANPASSTAAGGYVLLLGSEVENAGQIVTPKGQATLAAGDSFYIRRGVGTDGNLRSTTRGNEVATSLAADSAAGRVVNQGLIQAATGDITLTGRQVRQEGVALSSSSTDVRGTIHLLNSASDARGSVVLGEGSTTAVLVDASGAGALDSQRDAAQQALDGTTPTNNVIGRFDNLSRVADRSEQSRVEIVSGGSVDFQGGSLTLASGGQVAVSAAGRSLLRDGAQVDVAGAVGVKVAMESNNIQINVQGNEQRDAPVNRDGGGLASNDVWVDARELVLVPVAPTATPPIAGIPPAACWNWVATLARATIRYWRVDGPGRHPDLHRRRTGEPARLDGQPLRRDPRCAGRPDPADLAQGQRRTSLRNLPRPRRPALRGHLPRL